MTTLLAIGTHSALSAADIAAIVGGVAAAIFIYDVLRGWTKRTLGRKRILYRRLSRLGASAQLDYFVDTLEAAPAIQRSAVHDVTEFEGEVEVTVPREFVESFFVFPECYVQTISDSDETVIAYSVTSRRLRFRPTFVVPRGVSFTDRVNAYRRWRVWPSKLMKVKLHKTRFKDADVRRSDESEEDDDLKAPLLATGGARTWSYSERYYLGNPGYYQSYVISAGSNAEQSPFDYESLNKLAAAGGDPYEWTPELKRASRAFRSSTRITTFTVIAHRFFEENYQWTYGPHGDDVRVVG